MHPILFTLPNGFSIHVYGVMIAVGTIVAVGIASRWGRQAGFDKDLFTDLGFWSIVAGVAGARLEYIRVNREQFTTLGQMINVRDGGLVFYGGLIAVLVTFGVVIWRRKLNPLKVLDILAPLIPLGIVFGRLGCFAAGCCYGRSTDQPWGVVFPYHELTASYAGHPVHPTQLYEVGYGATLFLLMLWLRKRKRVDGQLILAVLTLYPVLRSVVEIFRGDEGRGWFLQEDLGMLISNAQFISILVALAAGAGWFVLLRQQRSKKTA